MLQLLIASVLAQTLVPLSSIADHRVIVAPTALIVAPGTETATTATISANANALPVGSAVWIEWDPTQATRVLVTNGIVRTARLALDNIVLGATNATGFTPGRKPIAFCTGGLGPTPDQWNGCTDARTVIQGVNLKAGRGIQIIPEPDGSYTIACTLP